MSSSAEQDTLAFINHYRKFELLWNPTHDDYNNRPRRCKAFKEFSQLVNMDVTAVKNKVKSLRSYFCKEHQKVLKKKKSINSTDENDYTSTWFAYKAMAPIMNKFESVNAVVKVNEHAVEDVVENYLSLEDLIREESANMSDVSNSVKEENCLIETAIINENSVRINGKSYNAELEDHEYHQVDPIKWSSSTKRAPEEKHEWCGCTTTTVCNELKNNEKDEWTVYGELVAFKMRKLNKRNQLQAQRRINNLILDLEEQQLRSTYE